MVSYKSLANVMGGKTSRACDSCIRKRARWYCAADDAFLCQTCDALVHSANPLARRHERVRLKTMSIKPFEGSLLENYLPSWQKGFKRKARTPRFITRKAKTEEPNRNPLHLVPDIGGDENYSNEENEEHELLYRVPIFDPFFSDLSTNSNEAVKTKEIVGSESKAILYDCTHEFNSLHGFLPSEMELAEFAADVESLLGKSLDEESFDMEELGFLDCKEKVSIMEGSLSSGKVIKNEEVELVMANNNQVNIEIDITREPFEFNFDYNSPVALEEDDKVGIGETIVKGDEGCKVDEMKMKMKKKILLRLDCDGVLAAWADQRSPWTTGERPELDPSDCWPDCLGGCGTVHHPYGNVGILCGQSSAMADRGREAIVSRYREKRRNRLFSKKIRYEVRKLNAEKRPRMKGRFVKRANFAEGTGFPLLGN